MAACPVRGPVAVVNGEMSLMDDLYNAQSHFKGFVTEKCVYEDEQCLVLSHRKLFNHPPLGLTSRVRIVIKANCQYVVQVVLRDFEKGALVPENAKEEVTVLCKKYATDSLLFKFCPGIDPAEYEEAVKVIRFNLKSVRKTTEPILRVELSVT
uniref:Uncharacterized protein n=1 Tax=Amphimedon queenslandica TaxID=400682 RepID=A0A1X7UFB1_AMPQE